MRSVMPSQVVAVIDRDFPFAVQNRKQGSIPAGHAPSLRAIVDLIDCVPDNLMTCSPEQYADLVHARAVILSTLERWKVREVDPMPMSRDGKDPVTVIRSSLAACSDEHPPAAHADLLFIPDVQLRESIRRDVGGAHRGLANAEWKAATVLAGSAIEALLLWRLSTAPAADLQRAIDAAVAKGLSKPRPDINRWMLNEFIEVALEAGAITASTRTAALLAKDYRNLIHPGATVRLGQVCNRGTAYMAVGALESVISDQTP